jgi:heme/copper-type cytochrome/quinol oxidase subunit 2
MWQQRKEVLKRHTLVIVGVTIFGIVFAATDYFAVRWSAWYYHSQRTLDIRFVTEVETFLFSAAIFFCVATATIISADIVDNLPKTRRHSNKNNKTTHAEQPTPR